MYFPHLSHRQTVRHPVAVISSPWIFLTHANEWRQKTRRTMHRIQRHTAFILLFSFLMAWMYLFRSRRSFQHCAAGREFGNFGVAGFLGRKVIYAVFVSSDVPRASRAFLGLECADAAQSGAFQHHLSLSAYVDGR